MSARSWTRLPLLGAALMLLAASSTARAQGDPQETIDKVVELNRQGVALYQKKKFDAARKTLKQALDLCEANGLEHHPVAARTHVHLGIVIVGGFGQREIGGKHFSAALQIQPDITLTPGVASPAVQDVFNEAAVAVTPRGAAPPPSPPAAEAEASPAGAAPEAEAAPASAPAESTAPADSEAPREATPSAAAAEEVPRTERRAPPPPGATARDEDEDDDRDERFKRSRIQIGALLGGGVGWASGYGDVNADTPVPGSFAAAKLGHLELEGGYWLNPTVMVSLQGRFQMVSGPTIIEAKGHTYQPASGATAIFAAATWSPTTGRLRPYASAAIGGGRIRHVVTLAGLKDCGAMHNEVCVDTVGAGPFLAGVGGGLTFDLGERLGLVLAVNTQFGAPSFTFNVDVNAGVAFHL